MMEGERGKVEESEGKERKKWKSVGGGFGRIKLGVGVTHLPGISSLFVSVNYDIFSSHLRDEKINRFAFYCLLYRRGQLISPLTESNGLPFPIPSLPWLFLI
jgi:hypothetical protein